MRRKLCAESGCRRVERFRSLCKKHHESHRVAGTLEQFPYTGSLELVRRWFEGLEVIEAKDPLRIQPNQDDIVGAIASNPAKCVFSRACKRQWESTKVMFFGTVAYIDLLDDDGKRHVERFTIPRKARAYIREFDEGKVTVPKGFTLLPPAPNETIEGKRKRAEKCRPALLKGKATRRKHPKASPTPSKFSISAGRLGIGRVQFPYSTEPPK